MINITQILQGTVTQNYFMPFQSLINITQILQGTVTSKTLYNNYIIFAIICYNYDGDKVSFLALMLEEKHYF